MGRRARARRGSEQIQFRCDALGVLRAYVRYTERGVRRFAILKATDEKAAEIEFAEMKLRIRKGEPAIPTELQVQAEAPGGLTVEALAKAFCGVDCEFKSGAGAENSDPVQYRRQFWSVLKCHVLPAIGKLSAMDVRPKDIKEMKKALLADEKHARTVQRSINHTSKLFNWAIIDEELIDRDNPCSRIKKPNPKSSTEFYSEDEVGRMLAEAAEHVPDLHVIIAFAFYTGCRRGEIAGVRWGDVDLEGGRILVQRSWKRNARKSGKTVTVHIHPHLDAILRAHRPAEPASDALVFPDPENGLMRRKHDGGVKGRNLWGLDKVIKLAKVRPFKRPWHSFRHAQATALAASGASLTEIRDALGQTTLQMAAQYAHLAATAVKQQIAKLPTLGPIAPSKVTSIHAPKGRDRPAVASEPSTQPCPVAPQST